MGSIPTAGAVKLRKSRFAFVILLVTLFGVAGGSSRVVEAADGDESGRCVSFIITDGSDSLAMVCSVNLAGGEPYADATAGGDYSDGGGGVCSGICLAIPHKRSGGASYNECGGGNYAWAAEVGPQTSTVFGLIPYGYIAWRQTAPNGACDGGYGSTFQAGPLSSPGVDLPGFVPNLNSGTTVANSLSMAWRASSSGAADDYNTTGVLELEAFQGATTSANVATFLNGNWPVGFAGADTPPGDTPPNACDDVDVTVGYKRLGETSFTTLANPSGTSSMRGDTIQLTFSRSDTTDATSFAFRWQASGDWHVLGGGASASYPLTVTLTRGDLAMDGPPSDLGAAELLCRSEGVSRYRLLAGTSDWATSSGLSRPCSNITWNWPAADQFLGDGTTTYPVSFTIASDNGGDAEITGLFVDHDEPARTYPEGRLAHFDSGDSDSYDYAVGNVYNGSVTSGSVLHNFGTGDYDPPDGEYTTGFFGFVIDGATAETILDASVFGIWCTDTVGGAILYRFDSSYASTPLDPLDPSRDPDRCFGDALGSMSLTSPKSWVTGIGRMGVCLVELVFVPEDGYVEQEVDGLVSALEEQLPFSLAFMLIDFAVDLNEAMEDSSSSGCFDTGGELSFGAYGDVPIDDVCLGGGGSSSAGSLLDIGSENRQLIAALMVTAIWFMVVRHAIATIRGVVAGDGGATQGSAYE